MGMPACDSNDFAKVMSRKYLQMSYKEAASREIFANSDFFSNQKTSMLAKTPDEIYVSFSAQTLKCFINLFLLFLNWQNKLSKLAGFFADSV